jgi:predicted alpha/beta hydrolase family esterase
MKKQLFLIHGGMTHKTYDDYLDYLSKRSVYLGAWSNWMDSINEDLCGEFDVTKLRMPNKDNAQYDEWRIHFERYLDLMEEGAILVGWSLGGIFLARYLSENKLDVKLSAVYFVAAPYDDSLKGEDLVNGFELGDDISAVKDSAEEVCMYFSKDDPVVCISHADKYKRALPGVCYEIMDCGYGHFALEKFPELLEKIKSHI